MPFKIDENLHEEVADLLRQSGHDAVTVREQQLSGSADDDLAAVCRREGRVIVTQDLDFSNIIAFPPEDHAGIIVFRLMTRADVPTSPQCGGCYQCWRRNRCRGDCGLSMTSAFAIGQGSSRDRVVGTRRVAERRPGPWP